LHQQHDALRSSRTALVLSGGGARAAYQVGALRALGEITGVTASPFSIIAGVSAGAINSAAVAVGADDFPSAARELTDTWLSLTPDVVYRTDTPKLISVGARWIKELTTGGALGRSRANYLLDTAPLRELLRRKIDLSRVAQHFQSGLLRGVAFSATNYLSGTTVTFYDGAPELQPWVRHDRIAFRETLTIDHVMASAAIPVFFPPVSIDGQPFGDGGVRMSTPISPAVHLGADKILAIGIRYPRTPEQCMAVNRTEQDADVSVAQIGGVLLNALFLDSLDNDLERLQRINRTLGLIPAGARHDDPDLLRRIPALLLRPSQDLGQLASDEYERFPAMLRHLLRGIGATGQSGWDLLSYLAFQPGYVSKLIDLGYSDTLARRAEIDAFFEAPSDGASASAFAAPSAAQQPGR
jgi:NTE family protein